MATATAAERFQQLERPLAVDAYNFDHFRTEHVVADAWMTLRGQGVAPGSPAPDFALPTVDGDTIRLSELRGRPVLLHFGSFT